MKKINILFLLFFLFSCSFFGKENIENKKNKNVNIETNNIEEEIGVEERCKKIFNGKEEEIISFDKQVLNKLLKINRALEFSDKDGEDKKFYETFHSLKKCKDIFINDIIMQNVCNVFKNKSIKSFNYINKYDNFTDTFDNNDKNELLGILSKFLGNNKFKCNERCENSYNDFMYLLNGNIKNVKLTDLYGMRTTEISFLIINGIFSKDEVKNFGINKCIELNSK